MWRGRRTLNVIAAALLAALLLLAGCGWDPDVMSTLYPDYDAVVKGGAIERGWVPEWLPASAVDIREQHNLDSNASLLTFSYDAADGAALGGTCVPTDEVEPPRFSAPWWPEDIAAVDSLYACEDGYLAVKGIRAWFWRP